MDWKRAATEVTWNTQPFVEGKYSPSTAGRFAQVNPATEEILHDSPAGSAEDVDRAVRAARVRFEDRSWSGLPAGRRGEILFKLADLIVEHKNEFALLDCLEMGKPIQEALHDAGQFAPSLLRTWAGFADKLTGASAPLMPGVMAFNVYEARGVVGAITPWNFPTVCAVYKFGPALAAGNTVVLKPSELAPGSALKLAELALVAGVPEGVLNVVPGLGATVGAALALHPDVDMLSFTGSTATGRKIMEMAGRSNGKPLLMECGGKSPHLVFDDVTHLNAVADAVAHGILWNQGQVCTARTRLLVHSSIKQDLIAGIVARIQQHPPGDPLSETTTFGPLASPNQRQRVRAYIEQGVRDGAKPILRGVIRERGGCYVSPTIFDDVDSGMTIAREEIFGPVLCVQSFETDNEAIASANATQYGLSATVWTRDIARARRVAHAVRAGAVAIRTSGKELPASGCVLSLEPQKASGFGSEIGLRGLQSYSTLKSVSFIGL